VPGCMPMGVGDGSIVRRAIIDKNARVGNRCQIINKDGVKESNQEGKGWVIKDGIIVIVKVRAKKAVFWPPVTLCNKPLKVRASKS